MFQFLVRRLIVAVLVAATVMTLAFILTRLSGDLAISIAGPNATQADVEAVRKAYGLDRPLVAQFFTWVGNALTGDLGDSYFFKARVSSLIAERMPVTLTRALTSTGHASSRAMPKSSATCAAQFSPTTSTRSPDRTPAEPRRCATVSVADASSA